MDTRRLSDTQRALLDDFLGFNWHLHCICPGQDNTLHAFMRNRSGSLFIGIARDGMVYEVEARLMQCQHAPGSHLAHLALPAFA